MHSETEVGRRRQERGPERQDLVAAGARREGVERSVLLETLLRRRSGLRVDPRRADACSETRDDERTGVRDRNERGDAREAGTDLHRRRSGDVAIFDRQLEAWSDREPARDADLRFRRERRLV